MRYKFRAWSKTKKKWYDRVLCGCDSDGTDYVCNLVWSDEHGDWVNFDEACGVVMQYTGLTDRNGTPIYEGDIITQNRVLNENSKNPLKENVVLIVSWDDGLAHRSDKSLELNPHARENMSWFNETPKFIATPAKKTKFTSYSWSPFHNCEVIGNIWEHPELLEG